MFGKKKQRIDDLEELCSEAYQVIGDMSCQLGIFETKKVDKVLSKLSQASNSMDISKEEILPFNTFRIIKNEWNLGQSWGYHAMFDCKAGSKIVVTNGELIRTFIRNLVDKINMKAFGEPILNHFAEHDPDKAGYTAIQMIETSDITIHLVDKNGDFYLDIFSCKPFDVRVAEDYINEFFHPENIRIHILLRQA